jgi:hypothetical protein
MKPLQQDGHATSTANEFDTFASCEVFYLSYAMLLGRPKQSTHYHHLLSPTAPLHLLPIHWFSFILLLYTMSKALLISSATGVGLTAPYFRQEFDLSAVESSVAMERTQLYEDILSLALRMDLFTGNALKSLNRGMRKLAHAALQESGSLYVEWMLQDMLLDRIAFASCPFDARKGLIQLHYVKPAEKPRNPDHPLNVVFEQYTRWAGNLKEHLKNWSEVYGEASYESSEALAESRALTFGPGRTGRLTRIVADMGKAFGMNEKKFKVNNTENNFLHASLGLIALMLVRFSGTDPSSFLTDALALRQRKVERDKNKEEYGLEWPYAPENVAAAKANALKSDKEWPFGTHVKDSSLIELLG